MGVTRLRREELSPELTSLVLEKIQHGFSDAEIIHTLGISRYNLRRIKDEHNIRRSSAKYSETHQNDVMELIYAEVPIKNIERETGVGIQTIRRWRNLAAETDPHIPALNTGKRKPTITPRKKYSEPELIELAFLNPGYGFDRFVQFLKVSKPFVFELFQSLKEFTNGEDDPWAVLQDPSHVRMVSHSEYFQATGRKYAPKGHGRKGNSAGRKANLLAAQNKVPLPPQEFNWGQIKSREWTVKSKPNWKSGDITELTFLEEFHYLDKGDTISASDRFRLFTGGQVGNTPQKGINWILGPNGYPEVLFCRSRIASGYGDRWLSLAEETYVYHLMIKNRNTGQAEINYAAKENRFLLEQQEHGAPILLMIDREGKSGLIDIQGWFNVLEARQDNPVHPGTDSVLLTRIVRDDG